MRDLEQMREKIQVSFEGREIAALSIGALVLLCSVFALGLALGRRLAQGPAPQAELSALDARADAPVRPADPRPRPALAARPAEKTKPLDAPVEVAAKKAPAPVRTKILAEASLGDTNKSEVAVVPPPPRETLVVPAPAQQPGGAIALTPAPRDVGAYTVQIGASPDRAEALRLENRARAAGLKPYSVEANLGAKGTWYRVRVGSFADKDKAGRFRADVERELRSGAMVMASH